MSTKESSIKIIKRTYRESLLQKKQYSVGQAKTEKQLARELFRTVASWVEERKDATRQGDLAQSSPIQ